MERKKKNNGELSGEENLIGGGKKGIQKGRKTTFFCMDGGERGGEEARHSWDGQKERGDKGGKSWAGGFESPYNYVSGGMVVEKTA